MASRTISHFELAGQIGSGGSGVVWKAYDTELRRPVALKFLKAAAAADPATRERFRREAIAASALNHSNIVTIYEIDFDCPEPFIAMELVDGRSLSDLLRQHHRLPARTVVEYAAQLSSGLGAAHRAGIVHRDIKPSNIMLRQDQVLKILDFGLAKTSVRESPAESRWGEALSAEGIAVGTVPYMSPEQAAGDPVGSGSDVFSLGAVLYEMLAGERPFRGSSNARVMYAVRSVEPAPLSSLAPGVPDSLARIVHRCLEKNIKDRYRDAGGVAREVAALDTRAWPRSIFDEPTRSVEVKKGLTGRVGQHPRLTALCALLALAIVAGGVYRLLPPPKVNSAQTAAGALAKNEALQRAQAYLLRYDRRGSIDSAIEQLMPIAQRKNASAAVLATLSEAYFRKYQETSDKDWLGKALETGRRATSAVDDLSDGHTALGMALAANGQAEAAAAEFQQAIGLNPRGGSAYVGLAKLRSGKEAEKLYQKGIDLSPGQWIPLNELAIFYYREARYNDCVTTLGRALVYTEDNVTLLGNLAAGLYKLGRHEEVANTLQRALRIDESNARIWANLGTAHYFLRRSAQAAAAAEKAVQLAPGRFLYWGNLGDDYRWAPGMKARALDAYREAIRLVREELKRNQADAGLRSILAAYLAKSGDTKAALKELPQIESLRESDALLKAALVYEIAGDRTSALRVMGRALAAGAPMQEIENEPEFASLRADPGYVRITTPAASKKQ